MIGAAQYRAIVPSAVMPVLVTGIHAVPQNIVFPKISVLIHVDGRIKSGHDGGGVCAPRAARQSREVHT
jgi:hypothetical protein